MGKLKPVTSDEIAALVEEVEGMTVNLRNVENRLRNILGDTSAADRIDCLLIFLHLSRAAADVAELYGFMTKMDQLGMRRPDGG